MLSLPNKNSLLRQPRGSLPEGTIVTLWFWFILASLSVFLWSPPGAPVCGHSWHTGKSEVDTIEHWDYTTTWVIQFFDINYERNYYKGLQPAESFIRQVCWISRCPVPCQLQTITIRAWHRCRMSGMNGNCFWNTSRHPNGLFFTFHDMFQTLTDRNTDAQHANVKRNVVGAVMRTCEMEKGSQ